MRGGKLTEFMKDYNQRRSSLITFLFEDSLRVTHRHAGHLCSVGFFFFLFATDDFFFLFVSSP